MKKKDCMAFGNMVITQVFFSDQKRGFQRELTDKKMPLSW